tara:strand:- start:6003 stop:6326 length:324 start_codon:yes stop_codon:yes gene_type:complete
MKRPVKKKQTIKKDSYRLQLYISYTPDNLRKIADEMDDEGVLSIEPTECMAEETRMETDAEFEKRYKKEYNQWKKWKAAQAERKQKEKDNLIKAAEKLGMRFVEEKQ